MAERTLHIIVTDTIKPGRDARMAEIMHDKIVPAIRKQLPEFKWKVYRPVVGGKLGLMILIGTGITPQTLVDFDTWVIDALEREHGKEGAWAYLKEWYDNLVPRSTWRCSRSRTGRTSKHRADVGAPAGHARGTPPWRSQPQWGPTRWRLPDRRPQAAAPSRRWVRPSAGPCATMGLGTGGDPSACAGHQDNGATTSKTGAAAASCAAAWASASAASSSSACSA